MEPLKTTKPYDIPPLSSLLKINPVLNPEFNYHKISIAPMLVLIILHYSFIHFLKGYNQYPFPFLSAIIISKRNALHRDDP